MKITREEVEAHVHSDGYTVYTYGAGYSLGFRKIKGAMRVISAPHGRPPDDIYFKHERTAEEALREYRQPSLPF